MKYKYLLKTMVVIMPALYLSGCVALQSEDDPVKKDVGLLKQEMAQQQQRLAGIDERLKKLVEPQIKRIDALEEAGQKEKAISRAALDRTREDMAFLQGKFEEVAAEAKRAKDDTAAIQENVKQDKTIAKKEVDVRFDSVDNRITSMDRKLSGIEEKIAALAASLEQVKASMIKEAQQKEAADKAAKQQAAPDDLYNEAIRLLQKDKDYANALEKLNAFLNSFPEHELAGNVQYWIGEIYYGQKDYERSVLAFNDVVKKYPKSNKVPAALLKQGMAFHELGNKKEARLLIEKVADKYPNTDEAATAKNLLKKLK